MLAKKNRLSNARDFRIVQEKGKVYQSKNLGLAYFERGDTDPPRIGFIVSTKISKDATDRNTIKRHMSETIRLMTKEIRDGIDIVFLAKTSIIRAPAEEIVKEVRNAVRGSGITRQ